MPTRSFAQILRRDLRANPRAYFIFGDNFLRRGKGGQAAEMRGEPNAIGLVTKHEPSDLPRAFLTDADLPAVQRANDVALSAIRFHLIQGGLLILPLAGIGRGMANLPRHAPAIMAYYDQLFAEFHYLSEKIPTGPRFVDWR